MSHALALVLTATALLTARAHAARKSVKTSGSIGAVDCVAQLTTGPSLSLSNALADFLAACDRGADDNELEYSGRMLARALILMPEDPVLSGVGRADEDRVVAAWAEVMIHAIERSENFMAHFLVANHLMRSLTEVHGEILDERKSAPVALGPLKRTRVARQIAMRLGTLCQFTMKPRPRLTKPITDLDPI